MYSPNGEQYRGSWKDNLRHGKGCLIYRNGAKYEGDWHAGVRHGLGTLWTYDDGKFKVKYTGGWSNDVPNGRGAFHDEQGNLYDGGWQDGRRAGQVRSKSASCVLLPSTAAHCVHAWQCSVPSWQGVWRTGIIWCTSTALHHDDFVFVFSCGNLTSFLRQGRMAYGGAAEGKDGDVYEGQWRNDLRHGKGTMTYANGNVYEGAAPIAHS